MPESPPPLVRVIAAPAAVRPVIVSRVFLDEDSAFHRLDCDRGLGGVWAGVSSLIGTWLEWVEASAPELPEGYGYELQTVLPSRRRQEEALPRSLTETSAGVERVRVFPADRVLRVVQGLVDFLIRSVRAAGSPPLILVCDGYDGASRLCRRFFHELVRRRGEIHLELILGVAPERLDEIAAEWGELIQEVHRVEGPDAEPEPSPEQAAAEVREIEERLLANPALEEVLLARLIRCLQWSGAKQRSLRGLGRALALYNRLGLYEDALDFAEPLTEGLDELTAGDETARLALVVQLYQTHVAVGRADRALAIVQQEGLEKIHDPKLLARVHYMLAMLHLRFLPAVDLALSEIHLERSLEETARAEMPEDDRQLEIAFSTNGLALVRHRQGRAAEAIELCRASLERIDAHFSRSRHALFRSVLIYNIAQVYAAMQRPEESLRYYTDAIELDPHYSEYYNERGSLLLKMGRLREAMEDYRRAISLSAPYAEVLTNLGQCHRLRGEAVEAVEAYSAALELSPRLFLALVGRAQANRALGRKEEALSDYGAALQVDGEQPFLWANRAVLHYEAGRLKESVADLSEAIRLSPGTADFYRNRAVALKALGQAEEASRDERSAVELSAAA